MMTTEKELDKLTCIHLGRRNLFNLADNSGVSMEKLSTLERAKSDVGWDER